MGISKHKTPVGVSMIVPCINLPKIETLLEWSNFTDEVCLILKSKTPLPEVALLKNLKISTQGLPGLSNALNQGVLEANYHFIRRMDSTDRLLPGSIANQISLIESNRVDLVYDLAKNRTFGFTFHPFTGKPAGHIVPNWAFLFCNPVVHPTVLANRNWFLDNPYINVSCEDFELWTRTALNSSIYCTGSFGLEYERKANQKSAMTFLNSTDLEILTKNLKKIIKKEFDLSLSDESIAIWINLIFSKKGSPSIISDENLQIFLELFTQLKVKINQLPENIRSYYLNYMLIASLRFLFRSHVNMRFRLKYIVKQLDLREIRLLIPLLFRRAQLGLFMKLDIWFS